MNYLILLGQALIALYFIIGVYNDILLRRQGIELLVLKKIPLPNFLYFGAVALKLVGGFAVLLNVFAAYGALLLAIFTLIANIIFNNFWREDPGMKRQFSLARFLCNLAVIGGLLLVIAIHR